MRDPFSGGSSFNLATFLLVALASFLNGGLVIALAELIGVFLHMEDHLEKMRNSMEQLNRNLVVGASASTQSIQPPVKTPAYSALPNPVPAPKRDVPPPIAMHDGPKLPGRVCLERTMLKSAPNGSVQTPAMPQHNITVVGRSADGGWLQVYKEDKGPYWAQTSTIDVDGDVSTLPVTYEGQG